MSGVSVTKTSARAVSFARACVTRKLEFDFEMAPHSLCGMSVSKVLALAYTELSSRLPKPSVRGTPSVLQIEPTNYCNLRCPLCASGVGAFSRPRGMMSFDLFKDILDEIGDGLSLIVLWNWGEPFLNPDIFRMIAYAKSKNIAVITSSNGQPIANASAARDIVSSGLDTLAIALDGATQETYQEYRVGGTVEKVLELLSLLRDAKQRINSATPLVNVRVVVTRKNESEIPQIVDLAREHGADIVTFRSASMPYYCGTDLDSTYTPDSPQYRMYRYDGNKRQPTDDFVCRRPWKRATINWDGTVVGCEHDFDNTEPFGVFPMDGSVMQILNSDRARAFRARFVKDRKCYKFCSECTFNDRVTEDCTVGRVDLR